MSRDIELFWTQALLECKDADQARLRWLELILDETVNFGEQLGENTDWIKIRWDF